MLILAILIFGGNKSQVENYVWIPTFERIKKILMIVKVEATAVSKKPPPLSKIYGGDSSFTAEKRWKV